MTTETPTVDHRLTPSEGRVHEVSPLSVILPASGTQPLPARAVLGAAGLSAGQHVLAWVNLPDATVIVHGPWPGEPTKF